MMQVQAQTTIEKSRIEIELRGRGLHWLRRLCHWFVCSHVSRRQEAILTWYYRLEDRHRQFQPLTAEVAMDLIARQDLGAGFWERSSPFNPMTHVNL